MMNILICRGNSHSFTFSAFSPKFGKLFGEVSFRQGGFSAKWLFGKVVFGQVSCIGKNPLTRKLIESCYKNRFVYCRPHVTCIVSSGTLRRHAHAIYSDFSRL